MTKRPFGILFLMSCLFLIPALAAGTPAPQSSKGPPLPPAQNKGFADPTSNPSVAASGGVEPLTPEQLQAFIPATMAKIPRTDIRGKTGKVGPGKMSSADATFAISDEKQIRITLFDRGGFPPSTKSPLPVPAKGETAKYLHYTVEGIVVGGYPAAQVMEGPLRKIQIISGRVRITLVGVGVEFSDLTEAAATLPLEEIAQKSTLPAAPPPETPKD